MACVAGLKEVKANDFNLNVSRYEEALSQLRETQRRDKVLFLVALCQWIDEI